MIVNLPHKTGIMSGKKAHKPGKEERGLKAWKVLWVFFYWVKGEWKGKKSCKKRENEKRAKRKNVVFRETIGLF